MALGCRLETCAYEFFNSRETRAQTWTTKMSFFDSLWVYHRYSRVRDAQPQLMIRYTHTDRVLEMSERISSTPGNASATGTTCPTPKMQELSLKNPSIMLFPMGAFLLLERLFPYTLIKFSLVFLATPLAFSVTTAMIYASFRSSWSSSVLDATVRLGGALFFRIRRPELLQDFLQSRSPDRFG